jgi:demethylmenaquinone methyltransferase/2-methoxy-6-polyprenyl-1,4-benzoquinol methylase
MATMDNQKHFDNIKKRFGGMAFGYDRLISLSGLGEGSTIRKESVAALNLKRGDTVLDLCCGTGLNFKLLEKNIGNDGRIIGIDLTPELLVYADARCNQNGWKNIELVTTNLLEYKTDVFADCALSTASIGMIPEYSQAIDSVMEHVKPEGIFVIVDAKPSVRLTTRVFDRLFSWTAKSVGFDIYSRDLVSYIQSKYEVVFYKEYLSGFGYTIAFKQK